MFSNLTPSVSSYSDRTYLDQTHSGQTCLGQTDCEQVSFELPEGLVLDAQIDAQIQTIYRCGQMRLATTADELVAQQATERMDNRAYGILVRLARVVSFADWPIPVSLSPDHLGHLFMSDLQYLIALYNEINPSAYGVSLVGELSAIL